MNSPTTTKHFGRFQSTAVMALLLAPLVGCDQNYNPFRLDALEKRFHCDDNQEIADLRFHLADIEPSKLSDEGKNRLAKLVDIFVEDERYDAGSDRLRCKAVVSLNGINANDTIPGLVLNSYGISPTTLQIRYVVNHPRHGEDKAIVWSDDAIVPTAGFPIRRFNVFRSEIQSALKAYRVGLHTSTSNYPENASGTATDVSAPDTGAADSGSGQSSGGEHRQHASNENDRVAGEGSERSIGSDGERPNPIPGTAAGQDGSPSGIFLHHWLRTRGETPDGHICAHVNATEDGFVSVRSGAGATFHEVGRLHAGDFLDVDACPRTACQGHWRKVKYWNFRDDPTLAHPLVGWVNSYLLSEVTCPSDEP